MVVKAKARKKGREVANSCLSAVFRKIATCFETLTCMLKCSSVFCNSTTTDAAKDKGEEEGEGGN